MYQQYFNFSALPFSTSPDPHFMFMSERHQEGLAHLLYSINMGGGFVALTGEVGTGKTTLCHCLLQQLPDNVDIALILNPKLSAQELLATICDELEIAGRFDMVVQTQLVLLQKTLLNIEGLGRQLYPDLDLWQTAKPFLENWFKEHIGPAKKIKELFAKFPEIGEQIPEVPGLIFQALQSAAHMEQQLQQQQKDMLELRKQLRRNNTRTLRAILGAGVLIAAALILQSPLLNG